MWIKTECGLFNLDKAAMIELTNLNTVWIDGSKAAQFQTEEAAQNFINKLAEKLEAENVD